MTNNTLDCKNNKYFYNIAVLSPKNHIQPQKMAHDAAINALLGLAYTQGCKTLRG